MPDKKDERESSGFGAFWTSLPGVLTGAAALVAAIGTLAALFFGNRDNGSTAAGPSAGGQPPAAQSAEAAACFGSFFEGIPRDRVASVEAGALDLDVITQNQPKAGTVGLRFTNSNRSIGATRFAYFPANEIFKIESVVDERCKTVEEYSNIARGGDKHVLQNYDTLRVRLGSALYEMRLGGGGTIELDFENVVP